MQRSRLKISKDRSLVQVGSLQGTIKPILVEDSVKTVFEMARKRLLSLHKEPDYEKLMKQALSSSLNEIGKNDLVIECNKTDSELSTEACE